LGSVSGENPSKIGCILCVLAVRCFPYISVLRPWFTISFLHLFVCSVLTLLVSISPSS
jgi:hypothetical protein